MHKGTKSVSFCIREMKMRIETVKSFVDRLQSQGRYSFEKKEVESNLNISADAVKKALSK